MSKLQCRATMMVVALSLALSAHAQTNQQPANAQAQPGQQAQAAPSNDVYHITAFRAAPGRMRELRDFITRPPAQGQPQEFFVLLRHEEGNEWDFMTITHVGPKATINAAPPGGTPPQPPPGPSFADMVAWHGDTFASGPPVEEFRRNLKLAAGQGGQQAGAQGKRSIYVVSDYAAAAGQRSQLQQTLRRIAGERPNRSVTLTHIEGAPWTFLTITQYDSWMDFAQVQEAERSAPAGGQAQTQAAAGEDMGMELRRSMAVHHDTIVSVAFMGEAGKTPQR